MLQQFETIFTCSELLRVLAVRHGEHAVHAVLGAGPPEPEGRFGQGTHGPGVRPAVYRPTLSLLPSHAERRKQLNYEISFVV